jgi:hypothetical protein
MFRMSGKLVESILTNSHLGGGGLLTAVHARGRVWRGEHVYSSELKNINSYMLRMYKVNCTPTFYTFSQERKLPIMSLVT